MWKNRLLGLAAAVALLCSAVGSAAAFSDVPRTHWAKTAIDQCADLGYLKGVGSNQFGLGQPMTRAAAVVTLSRVFSWPETALAAPYGDVDQGAWYASAINAAYAAGVITAQEADFRPQEAITREELAVMLVRALGYGTVSGLVERDLPFADAYTNLGYLTLCYDFGLMSGVTKTTFSPNGVATREQVATILVRLHRQLQQTPAATLGVVTDWEEESLLGHYETVAVMGKTVSGSGKRASLADAMSAKKIDAVRAYTSGRLLLGVSGKETVLKVPTETLAETLAKGAEGYDGLYLNLAASGEYREALTALAAALSERVETLYIVARPTAGYDLAALSQAADRLVLECEMLVEVVDGFTAAPESPTEQLLKAAEGAEGLPNVIMLLHGQGRVWSRGKESAPMTGAEVEALLEAETAHWSGRYGCAYAQSGSKAVWFLGQRGLQERMKLFALLGVREYGLAGAEDVYGG